MGSVIEIASTILSQSTRRVEVNAQNISNISTPGYKRAIAFSEVLDTRLQDAGTAELGIVSDLSRGNIVETGNPYDLALMGDGFFAVRAGEQLLYTRQGAFRRDGEGRLVSAQGFVLQARGGGDIILKGGDFRVTDNGVVLEDGQPVATIAVVNLIAAEVERTELGLFSAAQPAQIEQMSVRQGATEASNVSTGDEMVSMMEALRRAESAQRLVSVYDELMGRALTSFGQA